MLTWWAGLGLTAFWFSHSPASGWQQLLAAVTLLASGLGGLVGWLRSPQGRLVWDGEVWCWESPVYQTGTASHSVSVVADFQRVLVLRLENRANARLWLFVQRSAKPERWMDLRRAVYSPAASRRWAVPGVGVPASAVAGDAAACSSDLPVTVSQAFAHQLPIQS